MRAKSARVPRASSPRECRVSNETQEEKTPAMFVDRAVGDKLELKNFQRVVVFNSFDDVIKRKFVTF